VLVIPFVLIAVFGGVLFYRQTQKAGRELELRRIQSELAELSRLRQDAGEGELVPVPVTVRQASGRS